MRILTTIHRYWPSIGGSEAVGESLARGLVKLGHEVTVATSAEPNAPPTETREGVAIRRFDLRRAGKFRFPGRDYRNFVRQTDADIVVCHGQRVWSTDYIMDLAHRSPTPFALMAHGFFQFHMGRLRPAEWLYYHHVLPYGFGSRHCIADTVGEAHELAKFGIPPARVGIIPLAIEVSEFAVPQTGFREHYRLPPDEPILLYVGGFYDNKRVDDLIRVAARTRCCLVVVGRDSHPNEKALNASRLFAERLGADVRFLGSIPRRDVLSAYAESTLFVLASQFEGYGLVLLEAMAAGLPFVATRAGTAPELAALGAGISVATWEEMADNIALLLPDPARLRAMSEAGRRHARGFTKERLAADHEAFYERVIREQRV